MFSGNGTCATVQMVPLFAEVSERKSFHKSRDQFRGLPWLSLQQQVRAGNRSGDRIRSDLMDFIQGVLSH